MKAITKWTLVTLTAVVIAGCGGSGADNLPKTVDAMGIITLDGKTAEGVSIVAIPVEGSHPAHAISNASGQFSLKAFEAKDGAVPGSYKVRVSRTVEVSGRAPTAEELGEDYEHMTEEEKAGVGWVNNLPHKYADPNGSGLVLDVPDIGSTTLALKLVSE